ncbi:phosphorylase family protein [Streptomyces sp. NPDC002143]
MQETQPTVLVLTSLPLEYAAVRAHVQEPQEFVRPDGARVEIGQLPGTSWRVAIAELGARAERAGVLTTQLISWLHPEAVFFVGIAGSLKMTPTPASGLCGSRSVSPNGKPHTRTWPPCAVASPIA